MNAEHNLIITTISSQRKEPSKGHFLRCNEANWAEFRANAQRLDVTMNELVNVANQMLIKLIPPEG
jgi:hypothetical protein